MRYSRRFLAGRGTLFVSHQHLGRISRNRLYLALRQVEVQQRQAGPLDKPYRHASLRRRRRDGGF